MAFWSSSVRHGGNAVYRRTPIACATTLIQNNATTTTASNYHLWKVRPSSILLWRGCSTTVVAGFRNQIHDDDVWMNSRWFWSAVIGGMGVTAFTTANRALAMEEDSKKAVVGSMDETRPLTQLEMKQFLQEQLDKFRQLYFVQKGLPIPKIRTMVDRSGTLSAMSFRLSGNPLLALNAFMSTLQDSPLYDGENVDLQWKHYNFEEPFNMSLELKSGGEIKLIHRGDGHCEFVVEKQGQFMKAELRGLVDAYKKAWKYILSNDAQGRRITIAIPNQMNRAMEGMGPDVQPKIQSKDDALKALDNLGVQVFEPKDNSKDLTWDAMAGYDDVKSDIQDTLILALQHPSVYEGIASKTRARFESNRPRAILFEGPPGTGKTLSARIIAQETGVPLVHVKLENVLSKYYGEATKNMATIFDACEKLGGAIIFIDEIDALTGNREDGGMHEASRRILSVMLQKLEGFETGRETTLLCATNRKSDLDAALLSRFGLSITFNLPEREARTSIFQRYAKHLSDGELLRLGEETAGLSCRDIKEICEHAERRWAAKIIRREVHAPVPPASEYTQQLHSRDHTWNRRSLHIPI